MSCSKCKIELSGDELNKKIKCDYCKSQFCQRCSELSPTEIRSMQLTTKRVLKYACNECDAIIKTRFERLFQQFTEKQSEIQEQFETHLKTLQEDMVENINNLKTEVDNLKQSNIDLIKLLTDDKFKNGNPLFKDSSATGSPSFQPFTDNDSNVTSKSISVTISSQNNTEDCIKEPHNSIYEERPNHKHYNRRASSNDSQRNHNQNHNIEPTGIQKINRQQSDRDTVNSLAKANYSNTRQNQVTLSSGNKTENEDRKSVV